MNPINMELDNIGIVIFLITFIGVVGIMKEEAEEESAEKDVLFTVISFFCT